MKLILNLLTLMTFISAAELEIGSTMPKMDHALKDISGRTMTLSDMKGDAGTLVVFSLPYLSLGGSLGRQVCVPCR